ncbi:MAG: class I SAM-dependent methyltransferase [Kibdelosporangium sp.]
MADRETLRMTFDQDAEGYARNRPSYPAELFDDLAEFVVGRRALEIGCGTGQATIPLARKGFEVTAIELGANLAASARKAVAGVGTVEVIQAAFEQWPLPQEGFDLVVAATSWHWLDPATRVSKVADALRPGGVLAVISTEHVGGGTRPFFEDVQRCYERFDPATPPGLKQIESDDIPYDATEFERLGPVTFRRYHMDITYRTSDYLAVLATYSGHIALPADARAGLFDCVANLIDTKYGGAITKRYMIQSLLTNATR